MGFLLSLVASLGAVVANMGAQACFFLMADEPECPKSLIK